MIPFPALFSVRVRGGASHAKDRADQSIQLSVGRWARRPVLTGRGTLYDILAIAAASSIVLIGLLYAEVVYVFDLTTLLVSVVLPLTVGTAIFVVRKNRILLYAFLALFWTVIDDRPVFFDSVLTWPEVTRFHPFLPRLFMNVVIHALTILFLYLVVRESLKGSRVRIRDVPTVVVAALLSFVLAYAQNIPLSVVQNLVDTSWYPFDLAEKSAAIFFLCLAVWQAKKAVANHTSSSGRAQEGPP